MKLEVILKFGHLAATIQYIPKYLGTNTKRKVTVEKVCNRCSICNSLMPKGGIKLRGRSASVFPRRDDRPMQRQVFDCSDWSFLPRVSEINATAISV